MVALSGEDEGQKAGLCVRFNLHLLVLLDVGSRGHLGGLLSH